MGDIRTLDMMLGALNCPFGTGHMGVTAENVAAERRISVLRKMRSRWDHKTVRRRRLKRDILTVKSLLWMSKSNATWFHFCAMNIPKQQRPKRWQDCDPFFKDGSVTAGNASGINDGAAAIVLATATAAEKSGLKPRVFLGMHMRAFAPRSWASALFSG